MKTAIIDAATKNFLGNSPMWFKVTMLIFLGINPILLYTLGAFFTGWLIIAQFIFCLAMALKCYPLQSGGLIALECILLRLTTPTAVYLEIKANFQVVLLLIFMVAGIYFMKQLLMVTFTRILLHVRCKMQLSFLFMLVAAFLSAFLDALTVTAVIISVGVGFYAVYHKVASGKPLHIEDHDHGHDEQVHELHREELDTFRAFLRSLLMHSVIGTALGGVCTLVGEPQNLLIAERAGWTFMEFFFRMAPVTLPVLCCGLFTCFILERGKFFGYGIELPANVRSILHESATEEASKMTQRAKCALFVQALAAIWLVVALGLHLAEVGLIGLSVIILITAFTGVTEEHQIGKAFEEALPFTALLIVFFAIVALIHDNYLFKPVLDRVISMRGNQQIAMFYLANGFLSMISDNVFVATVYMDAVSEALRTGQITRDQFDLIAVAVNTGTNLPSVATPNGQAAFLFLLTSTIAPLVRLSYGRMLLMAMPYALVMTLTGFLITGLFLQDVTRIMYDNHLIRHHQARQHGSAPKLHELTP